MKFGYSVTFSERARDRVVRWSPDTGAVDVVAGEPSDGSLDQKLSEPYGLSFDHEKNLVIADKANNRLCRVRNGRLEPLKLRDVDGHRAKRPESRPNYQPDLLGPTGLWLEGSGSLLCAFYDDPTIYRIHRDGRLELLLGIPPNRPYHYGGVPETVPPSEIPGAPLMEPLAIVERRDGTVFFIERFAQIVREYHPKRGLSCVFPFARQPEFSRRSHAPDRSAVADYHPAYPTALALDASERLHVGDLVHGCVLRVSADSRTVTKVLELERGEGVVAGPVGLTFGPDGTAWVLNTLQGALEAYDARGSGRWRSLAVRLTEVRGEPLRLLEGGAGIVCG